MNPGDELIAYAIKELSSRTCAPLMSADVNPFVRDNGSDAALTQCEELAAFLQAFNASSLATHIPSTQGVPSSAANTAALVLPPSPCINVLPSLDVVELMEYCEEERSQRSSKRRCRDAEGHATTPAGSSHRQQKVAAPSGSEIMRHVTKVVISQFFELQRLPLISIAEFGGTLRHLDISRNAIRSCPAALFATSHGRRKICTLPNLTHLNVSNNQLLTLPQEVHLLARLEVINIEDNRIVAFPNEMRYTPSLRHLLVGHNPLASDEEIPDTEMYATTETASEGENPSTSRFLRPGIPSANTMLDGLLLMESHDRQRDSNAAHASSHIKKTCSVNPVECCVCGAPLLEQWATVFRDQSQASKEATPNCTLPYVLLNFVDFLNNKSVPFSFCVCGNAESDAEGTAKKRTNCGAIVVHELLEAVPVNYSKLDYSTAEA